MLHPAFWHGKRVLLTGHTGFKGAWLALWLKQLGAEVTGLSLPPDTEPNLHTLLGPELVAHSHETDVRDREGVAKVVHSARPDIVLHLAAQALVRRSYREPVETFATNLMGTLHVLDALRVAQSEAITLIITSDKVYQNRDDGHPFREDDPLGGDDPYSASKGALEIAVHSWRKSFRAESGPVIATARAGNVIGGGDWSEDRLIPDYIRALKAHEPFVLRNPNATRPWQHVLDVCYGYLLYVQHLAENPAATRTLNLGPDAHACLPTHTVIERLARHLPEHAPVQYANAPGVAEKLHLALNPELAGLTLGWRSHLSIDDTIRWTADWYAAWLRGENVRSFSESQLAHFIQRLTPQ